MKKSRMGCGSVRVDGDEKLLFETTAENARETAYDKAKTTRAIFRFGKCHFAQRLGNNRKSRSTASMTNDPVLIAYTVKRKPTGTTVWTRIGAAYPHDAGAGLTVILDANPIDGRIILLEPDAAERP